MDLCAVSKQELRGLTECMEKFKLKKGFVITGSVSDFGIMDISTEAQVYKIPAPIACYWLGQVDISW